MECGALCIVVFPNTAAFCSAVNGRCSTLCDLPVFSLLPDLNESCILTVKSQQFLMLSSFNDTAVIYYKYLISRFDRCKSVCDYDNGLTL